MTDIDLFAPETQENWYPTYELLRDEHPVYLVPGTKMFVVSRHADVMHVLRRQDIFPTGSGSRQNAAAAAVYAEHDVERMTPLSTNPPEHRRYRGTIDGFFDIDGAARYTAAIEHAIDNLLASFEADGQVEFVEQFAIPLPVQIIGHILGFPDEDIPQLKRWSAAWVLPFSGSLSEEQEVFVAEQVVEFHHYIAKIIEQRRAEPVDDVISALLTTTIADPPDAADSGDAERLLTDREIITIIDHLYIGGNETTTFALTSALWILLREDGLYERLVADPSIIPAFIEEVLRLESPTQGLYRSVAQDTELHGVAIPKGAVVHIRYAAANRDERIFPEPDQVDLERANGRRHVAFSLGEHHCPGASLSRLEQKLALEAILSRLPRLRFAPGNDFAHAPGFVLRALNELHLEFDKPSQTAG